MANNCCIHKVRPRDTICWIANSFKVRLEDIMDLNPGVDLCNLQVGQELKIPCCGGTQPQPTRDSLTYLFGGTSDNYLELLAQTKNSIKTVCPDYFDLTESGNLIVAGSNKLNPGFIDTLHGQNIKVAPFISNHWDRPTGEAALNNREALSTQIAQAVMQHNLDGVDVDIENVNHLFREQNTDLMRLLRQKLPNKIVSMAVAANPNNWQTGWHGLYDYKALSNYADYLMIMAYDEHYFGSVPGPVSSSNFFNRSIQFGLNEGVPKEKLIAGIPFFGRWWKVGESPGGWGLRARDVVMLLANYQSNVRFDEPTKSAVAEVTILPTDTPPIVLGNRTLTPGTYTIWYDDEEATRYKLNVINGYDLRGAGSWALGQEILGIWDFYTDALNKEKTAPTNAIIPPPHPAPIPDPVPIPAPGQLYSVFN